MDTSLIARLVSKVEARDNGCWEWTGATDLQGYGRIKSHGKSLRVHRLTYEIFVGSILDGMYILHRCDNRICVNPEHLVVGTQRDNIRDMYAKGRGVDNSGENHGKAILTKDQVVEILDLLQRGYSQKEIGQMYHVNSATINSIANGKSWKCVQGKVDAYPILAH